MASESIAHEAEGLYGEALLEGLPFSGFRYLKSRDFTCWSIQFVQKGREVCHLSLLKGPSSLLHSRF